jgi:hypothetical protein
MTADRRSTNRGQSELKQAQAPWRRRRHSGTQACRESMPNLDHAGIEGSIVDQINTLRAVIGGANTAPVAFENSRFQFLPNRRDLPAYGEAIPLPSRIDQHRAVTDRNSCALSTETRPPRVLSLPRTGVRKTVSLPRGLAQGAGTWAGDSSSPAQSLFTQHSFSQST